MRNFDHLAVQGLQTDGSSCGTLLVWSRCSPGSGALTHGVDFNAVAQELGGGRGHDVIHPLVILCMPRADWWMMAHLHRHP